MSKKTENIEQMEAKRRELDRKIRAAKRVEAKAAKEALLSERHALGVWLAESVDADSIESVQLLRVALESGQIQRHLRQEVGTDSPDSSEHREHEYGGDHRDVA